MPIDFPTGPTTGQVYSYQGKSWVYNGTGWDPLAPSFGDASLPAGSIIQWGSNSIPTNWLLCNGSAVSRSTFSSLFAAIGTLYGAGDGTTTFNLPDLRGRVAVGLDSTQTEFDTLGESGGAKTVTLTEAQMPSHTHRTGISSSIFYGAGPAGVSTTQVSLDQNVGVFTGATGGGQAHNNLQPYEVLHYIIKASAGTTAGDSELATRLGVAEAAVGQRALSSNAIINGGFDIWQRGTSLNLPSGVSSYLADRFNIRVDGPAGTPVYSRQSFTPGSAPVAGYEGAFFARFTTGGNVSCSAFNQAIEDVRTFAGQTVTLSFWMKTSTPKTFTLNVRQDFGSGGSSIVDHTATYTTTTSWQRFTQTFNLTSLAGKTIGTNNALWLQLIAYTAQTGNFDVDVWGVQLEAGNVATPFKRNAPSIQAELAACQRYYWRSTPGTAFATYGQGLTYAASAANIYIQTPVPMRTIPTSFEGSNIIALDSSFSGGGTQNFGIVTVESTNQVIDVNVNGATSFTSNRPAILRNNNNAAGFIGFSAEL